jgi:4'-phosphopantetheinyl transferase
MPLLFSRHPRPGATFGLWHIDEPESYFGSGLHLAENEQSELAHLREMRRLEWLAARWLLHRFSGEKIRLPMAKDAFSKPFFPDDLQKTCSLSHSQGVVGALYAEGLGSEIGCDIQVMVEKIRRIAPKFVGAAEWAFIRSQPQAYYDDFLHLIWTAKESMYKAYGLRELDFRGHLYIEPFGWDGCSARATGFIRKGSYEARYDLFFEKTVLPDERQLVWNLSFRT